MANENIKIMNWKNGLLLSTVSYMLYLILWFILDDETAGQLPEMAIADYIIDYLLCMLFTYISLGFSFLVFRVLPFRTSYVWVIVYASCLFTLNNVVAFGMISLFNFLWGENGNGLLDELLNMKGAYTFAMISTFLSSVYANTFYLQSYIKARNEKQALEMALMKEKEIALQSQLNSLKLQTNPQKEKESVFTSLKSLLTNVAFWVILLYFAAPSLPGWATKNWLPTLFAENLDLPMSQAGPISTITIAVSSFIGVLIGGPLSDKWVQKNLRGRVYTGAIGLGLTIPSLLLLGFGHNLVAVVGAGLLFGIGYGIFDTNNMPILCQFVSHKQRATAYGVMNMIGVSAGAFITHLLGRWGDSGNLGVGFAMLAIVVAIALGVQLYFLRPKTDNME